MAKKSKALNLDDLRVELREWSDNLWVERGDRGGFRLDRRGDAHLMTTFDMAWIRHATNDVNTIDEAKRAAWIRWIRQNQCWEDGRYAYPPGEVHSDGHAFWQAVRSLHILGGQLALVPKHLELVMKGPDGFREWFVQWHKESSNHHDILGAVPAVVSMGDPAMLEVLYEELAAQQDPETGTWPKGERMSISRTYAYTVLFNASSRIPPQPEKIVDAMLECQLDSGSWGPKYSSMDAVYILVRLAPLIDHRLKDVEKALTRNADWLPEMYTEWKDKLFERPHDLAAVVHNFGLLSEVFPDRFPATKPYQFGWEKPEAYVCDVIREHVAKLKG